MARPSSGGGGGGGSRFASANLNDLYNKQLFHSSSSSSSKQQQHQHQHQPQQLQQSGSSSSRYHHGGMLVLARPGRSSAQQGRSSKPGPQKLTVPAPVNLPSLRKEHAGNDPNISLVGGSGVSGWSKQQIDEDGTTASSLRTNGWGVAERPRSAELEAQFRSGKYTPPGARGSSSPVPVRHATAPPANAFLRGEDFPSLQAAAPVNPPSGQQRQKDLQQRQRDKNRELKEQQVKLQQLSENAKEVEQPLSLHPQAKSSSALSREESSFKENRKPNDLPLRPAPLIHLNHPWADDDREVSRPPEWDDRPSQASRTGFKDERVSSNGFGRARDFGWEREGHFGRGEPPRDWTSGRMGSFDRLEVDVTRDWSREYRWGRDGGYGADSIPVRGREGYLRDDFFNKAGMADRGRFGGRVCFGMDFGRSRKPVVSHNMSFSEDSFMKEFPELPTADLLANKARRRKDEGLDVVRDPERESFESELERVQKEQEQERQRKLEERERAIKLARKEQEERERYAREEEERQRRLEEEAREAAARAEQEALETERKLEDARRAREEEKLKMQEEEERRKENARRKLQELEERIAKREMEKKQGGQNEAVPDDFVPPKPSLRREDDDRRFPRPVSSPIRLRGDQEPTLSRLRSPDVHSPFAMNRERAPEARFTSSWRREGEVEGAGLLHDHPELPFSPLREHRPAAEVESFYGNFDVYHPSGGRPEEKWITGEGRGYSPRTAFVGPNLLDGKDDRWGRRGRPFSPPSPTAYGDPDVVPYGRHRSLPKQPRVPPPLVRLPVQRLSSLKARSLEDMQQASKLDMRAMEENRDEEGALASTECEGEHVEVEDEIRASELPDKHMLKDDEEQATEFVAETLAVLGEEAEVLTVEKHVVDAVVDEPLTDDGEHSPRFESSKGTDDEENESAAEGEVSTTVEESPELAEMVHSMSNEEEEQVEQLVEGHEERKDGRVASPETEQISPLQEQPSLLPPPVQRLQQQQQLVHAEVKQQNNFNQPGPYLPPQMPLADARPRMQPHNERPMTLQFGLLPGTSLLQGSVPAIQIGSIQMPLQLHPIGHVTHMQPPPQFQFGQQPPPMMPSFTVHPQAMLQPQMMNMEGGSHNHQVPAHQYHLQPHPERTFWTQFGQGPQQVSQAAADRNQKSQDTAAVPPPSAKEQVVIEKDASEKLERRHSAEFTSRRKSSRRESKAQSNAQYVPRKSNNRAEQNAKEVDVGHKTRGNAVSPSQNDEDDFIEVRSKRQLLNERREEKEKLVKSKSKYNKVKEQPAQKQKSMSKKTPVNDRASLPDIELDAVIGTVRTSNLSVSNAEVGYEKRTKSPQPSHNNSLASAAPAFPSFVGDSSWGFSREVHLDDAVKSRFEGASEGEASGGKSGPVNSLLAGEKIQFGAVTMPASANWPALAPRPEELMGDKAAGDEDAAKKPTGPEDGITISGVDSEAEAEAAASAVAAAAISNDDYGHNIDPQHVSSHGIIGSAPSNLPHSAASRAPDDVSLPADLSVDAPTLRAPPHSGQHLSSIQAGFPGMENLLGGPAFPYNQAADKTGKAGEQGRPPAPWTQQHQHSGVDSFYGGPPSYAGPFINHGPMPTLPPQTLVYTNPFGVGQFGQLGVSFMGPMPSVKQPDWKHTPAPASTGASASSAEMMYGQHGNRHGNHDPSVISVMPPPGPFDVYRDVAYHQVSNVDLSMQPHWSHIPAPHLHNGPLPGTMPGFSMQLRHPPPPYHMQQADTIGESKAKNGGNAAEPTERFPDELGLSDTVNGDAASLLSQQAMVKPASPLSAGNRPRQVNGVSSEASSSCSSSNSECDAGAFVPAYSIPSRRPLNHSERKSSSSSSSQQQHAAAAKVAAAGAWSAPPPRKAVNQGRQQQGIGADKNVAAGRLKQVYVAKPSSTTVLSSGETTMEVFTAEARHA